MEQTSSVEQTVSSMHEQKVARMKIVEQTSPVRAVQVVEHVMIVGVVGIVEKMRWGGMIELRML